VQQVTNHSLANVTAFSTPLSKDRSATELKVHRGQALTNASVFLFTISDLPYYTLLSIVFLTLINNNSSFIES
jgi:hypothetical protein